MTNDHFTIQLIRSIILTVFLAIICFFTRITDNDFDGATLINTNQTKNCQTATNCFNDICEMQHQNNVSTRVIFHKQTCPEFQTISLGHDIPNGWFIAYDCLVMMEIATALLCCVFLARYKKYIFANTEQILYGSSEYSKFSRMKKLFYIDLLLYFSVKIAIYVFTIIVFSYDITEAM